jgi:hypothetical protein
MGAFTYSRLLPFDYRRQTGYSHHWQTFGHINHHWHISIGTGSLEFNIRSCESILLAIDYHKISLKWITMTEVSFTWFSKSGLVINDVTYIAWLFALRISLLNWRDGLCSSRALDIGSEVYICDRHDISVIFNTNLWECVASERIVARIESLVRWFQQAMISKNYVVEHKIPLFPFWVSIYRTGGHKAPISIPRRYTCMLLHACIRWHFRT